MLDTPGDQSPRLDMPGSDGEKNKDESAHNFGSLFWALGLWIYDECGFRPFGESSGGVVLTHIWDLGFATSSDSEDNDSGR